MLLFAAAGHKLEPHHEVQDMEKTWDFFHVIGGGLSLNLPSFELFGYHFQLTKYMVLELIAAAIIIAIFVPLARRIRTGELPRGRFWNLFEGLLVFVRDEIARPNLDAPTHEHSHGEKGGAHEGHDQHPYGEHPPVELHPKGPLVEHEADKYVPFLWTLFLFVLACNLLGMIPMMGSPTASIWVTAGLAVMSFVMLHGVGILKYGPIRYFTNLWPRLGPALILVSLMIFVIELMGTFIKSGVLAVRLFANMFAGHLVLATILFFIYAVGNLVMQGQAGYLLWGGVTFASILGVVALSLLELFVGVLQAYIFTFLTALFMGMSLHAEH